MLLIIATIALLGLIGLAGAVVLYVTAKKFSVDEDPRVEAIAGLLPGANCGGCGMKGCRDFAAACVAKGSLQGINCPVSGPEGMAAIARILGVDAVSSERTIAVLHCNGSCAARPERYGYDGASSCRVMDAVAVGTRGCSWGCLGCGDCTEVCAFGAIRLTPATGLPEIDASACTGCGKCAKECPRHLISLRPEGRRGRRVTVACSSRDRGAVARKICSAACIGCGKCGRTCPFGAITVTDNVAVVDPALCRTCGKCLAVCPTGALTATFTMPKPVEPQAPQP